jgi:uncharacterized membrane protein YcaP (DUF421 family)
MSALPSIFTDLFVLKVPLSEKILRALIVYFSLIVLLRVFGKRELAQLNPFDLVVLLTLSNTVQNAIIGDDNTLLGGIVGAITLLGANYLIVRFMLGHRRLDELLAGSPTVLMEHGKILRRALAKEMMSVHDLEAAARRQGFRSLSEVEQCTLEPTGVLCFTGRQPLLEDRYQAELVSRLDRLGAELAEIKSRLKP